MGSLSYVSSKCKRIHDDHSRIPVNRADLSSHGLQTPPLLRSIRIFNLMLSVPCDDYVVIRHQATGFECCKMT